MCLCSDSQSAPAAEFQPLSANAARLVEALELLGFPLAPQQAAALSAARTQSDAAQFEKLLDAQAALVVTISPNESLALTAGAAPLRVQQAGYVPQIVKIVNRAGTARPLLVTSPQAGPVYGGEAELSLTRQGRLDLRSDLKDRAAPERFLDVGWFTEQPMTALPRGLAVEYGVLLIYSHVAGEHPAVLRAALAAPDGKSSSAPVEWKTMLRAQAAVPVRLRVADFDGAPTVGRFTFRDRLGHVYPPQAKRLAPDFFFQQQVYRRDGDTVFLPPGEFTVEYSRGPEYKLLSRRVTIPPPADSATPAVHELSFQLERWIHPQAHGFYGGDHHIHAAGCAHYNLPTQGVLAPDMFLQIKGEGLNVGSVLTWGPCFEYQRQFFGAEAHPLSESLTLIKYDVEVSGFGSAPLGHVCLLNLRDHDYPGAEGTKLKGWPTWTTPVMRWTKEQGGYAGYAHSASGMAIDAEGAAGRLLVQFDVDKDGLLSADETHDALLPKPFATIDTSGDGRLDKAELTAVHRRAAEELPNYAVPEMSGAGALEICVSAAHGVCDFISAMDTERIQEWNTWYHLLNCGVPMKVSGETDFPCMSSTRVGQGRTYVQLGKVDKLIYSDWCRGLAEGRSYVSDGFAHALDFTVAGRRYGERVALAAPGTVEVTARVAFSSQTPAGVPYGTVPATGRRHVGDTRTLYPDAERPQARERLVEAVVNGEVVARQTVAADDQVHDVKFSLPIERSSWVAVRQFPQLHTNPLEVLVAGKPIRASSASARWCIAAIEQLWRTRAKVIAERERPEAEQAFERAKEFYRRIAAESMP